MGGQFDDFSGDLSFHASPPWAQPPQTMHPPSFMTGESAPYEAQQYVPVFSNYMPLLPPPPPTSANGGGNGPKYKYAYGHFLPVEGSVDYPERAQEGARMFGDAVENAFIAPPYLDEEYGYNECESEEWNE